MIHPELYFEQEDGLTFKDLFSHRGSLASSGLLGVCIGWVSFSDSFGTFLTAFWVELGEENRELHVCKVALINERVPECVTA
jgi:hypothetical protein